MNKNLVGIAISGTVVLGLMGIGIHQLGEQRTTSNAEEAVEFGALAKSRSKAEKPSTMTAYEALSYKEKADSEKGAKSSTSEKLASEITSNSTSITSSKKAGITAKQAEKMALETFNKQPHSITDGWVPKVKTSATVDDGVSYSVQVFDTPEHFVEYSVDKTTGKVTSHNLMYPTFTEDDATAAAIAYMADDFSAYKWIRTTQTAPGGDIWVYFKSPDEGAQAVTTLAYNSEGTLVKVHIN